MSRSRQNVREDDAPRALVAPHGLKFAWKCSYISPACNELTDVSFKGFPRTFITAGDAEMLLDQIRVLYKRMSADLGEKDVVYYEAKDSVHDYLVFPWHEPERSQTFAEITGWVASL